MADGGWKVVMETKSSKKTCYWKLKRGCSSDTISKATAYCNLENRKYSELVDPAKEIYMQNVESAKWFLLTASDIIQDTEVKEETTQFSS